MPAHRLLAWIEPRDDGVFLAAFVTALAADRPPATELCASRDEAREWILTQAGGLRVTVDWLTARPGDA